MEKKEPIKVSLSTFFLFIAIIVIAVLGYFTFDLYVENQNSKEELSSLNNEISTLENSVKDYKSKIDAISNTINSNTNKTENPSTNSSDNKYSIITKELNEDTVLFVTNSIKNTDGSYTLKGKLKKIDTSKPQETEFPYWIETEEYKQITISADTKCTYSPDSVGDDITDTVKNVFDKDLSFGDCFNFSFENGKCVLVKEVVTGH